MAGRISWTSIVVVGLLGCGGDDGTGDSGSDDTSGAATAGSTMTAGSATTMSTSASSADTGSGSATGDDDDPGTQGPSSTSETADGPGSSGDDTGPGSSGDPGDDGAGVCEGAQANACLDCAVGACCQQWTDCQADEGCTCVVNCHVVRGGSLGSCESQCGSDGELYQALFFCGQQSCLGTCEWDCC